MANSLQAAANSLHLMGFTGGFAYSALIPVTSTMKASQGLSELTIVGDGGRGGGGVQARRDCEILPQKM